MAIAPMNAYTLRELQERRASQARILRVSGHGGGRKTSSPGQEDVEEDAQVHDGRRAGLKFGTEPVNEVAEEEARDAARDLRRAVPRVAPSVEGCNGGDDRRVDLEGCLDLHRGQIGRQASSASSRDGGVPCRKLELARRRTAEEDLDVAAHSRRCSARRGGRGSDGGDGGSQASGGARTSVSSCGLGSARAADSRHASRPAHAILRQEPASGRARERGSGWGVRWAP